MYHHGIFYKKLTYIYYVQFSFSIQSDNINLDTSENSRSLRSVNNSLSKGSTKSHQSTLILRKVKNPRRPTQVAQSPKLSLMATKLPSPGESNASPSRSIKCFAPQKTPTTTPAEQKATQRTQYKTKNSETS